MIIKKLYTEKYRPKNIDGVILLPRIQKELLDDNGDVQLSGNYLFSSSPGTGKTSLANVLVPDGALKVNASYNSSVDDLKEHVIDYCRTADIFGSNTIGGYKIVYLDEFDGVSGKYQEALRGFIEEYSDRIRFIATCCAKDTKVYTEYGYQLIQNIKNEKLLTHTGQLQENQNLKLSRTDSIYKIKTIHNFKIDVTPEHQFYNNNEWVQANTLNENDNITIDLKSLYGNNYRQEYYYSNNLIDRNKFINYLKQNNFLYKEEINKIKNDNILLLTENDFNTFKQLKLFKTLKQKNKRTKYISKNEILDICLTNNLSTHYCYEFINRLINTNILINENNQYYISDTGKAIKDLKIYVCNYIKYNYKHINIDIIKNIKTLNTRITIDDILNKLDNVLNIKSNDLNKISSIARICGMLYGDGHLKNNSMYFAASNDDTLFKVKKDLLNIFNDIEYKFIQNGPDSNGRIMNVSNKIYATFFNYFGCPFGNKVLNNNIKLPKICYKHKHFFRMFIQSLFDCEMNTYRFAENNKTVKSIVFRQNTINKESTFFNELNILLKKHFNIESTIQIKHISLNDQNKRYSFNDKSGITKYTNHLTIVKQDDILKYMEIIGNYYEDKNIRYDIYGYLIYKKNVIGYNFLTFNDWKDIYYNNGNIIDTIRSINIRNKKYNQIVYDCSLNEIHSYMTNGFISHNCNNLSKISPAMLSRFNVIKFDPENQEEIDYLKDHYFERCELIKEKNNLNISDEQLKSLINITFPDLRSVFNTLQVIEKTGGYNKIANSNINVDLYNIIFGQIKEDKTYTWVVENFGDKVENLLKMCGRPLSLYIFEFKQDYISKVPKLMKIVNDSLNELNNSPDPLVLAISCIYSIQEVINNK